MKQFSANAFGVAAALVLSTTASQAEMTAMQAWENLQSYSANMGQTITGTETMSGDTLTVSDVTIALAVPEASVNGTMDEMTFTQNGDGTVSIAMSPTITLKVSAQPDDEGPDAEKVDMTMVMTQTGMNVIAAGDGDTSTYDFSVAKMAFEMSEILVDNKPVDMSMIIDASDMVGKYTATDSVSGEATIAALTFAMKGTDPENGAKIDMSGKMADLAASSVTKMVEGFDNSDMGAMLQAGFATEGRLTYGATTTTMSGDEDGELFNMTATTAGGALGYTLNSETMAYDAAYNDVDVVVSGSDIPFPQVNVKIAETGLGIKMPVAKSDTPQPFALLTSLKGLSISNEIWSMFDPAGQLPRDPANLIVDLEGTGNWLINIFDEDTTKHMEAAPGELHALDIKGLELSVAGASLTGKGGFTFDNSDLTTYEGMPKPVGKLSLLLKGGNTLLDTLVNMGLLPEEQATGVRMMSGMFARPGDGNDTLVSEIELTESGQVLANGQRLK